MTYMSHFSKVCLRKSVTNEQLTPSNGNTWLTAWNAMVMANVCIGLTVGKTAKIVSPTRPLEVEAMPVSFKLTSIPRHLITKEIQVNVHTSVD